MTNFFKILGVTLLVTSCSQKEDRLFEKLASSDSNITFKNGKNSRIICYICDDKSKVINNSDILYYERKRY